MVGFEKQITELEALGATVYAASVDPEEKAQEVADEVSYPVAYGAMRADGDAIGAWWEDRRGIIQPSEFLLASDGRVATSSYSSGPIGRIEPRDVIGLIKFLESRK